MPQRAAPFLLVVLIAALCAMPASATSAPLALDPDFGAGGTVEGGTATPGYRNAAGVAVTPDGKVLVAAVGDGITSVARYERDGALDVDFGESGVSQLSSVPAVAANSIGSIGGVSDLAVDRGGRPLLLLRGTRLVRLTAAGAIDSAWSERASASISRAVLANHYVALAPLADGGLVLAGYGYGSPRMLVARLRADGSLDPSFGQGGFATPKVGGGDANAAAKQVAVSADGRVLLAGSWHLRPALVRLLPNGRADRSFGRNGRVVIRQLHGEATALKLMPNGATLLSCACWRARAWVLPLLRFGRRGRLDRGFSKASLRHRVRRALRPNFLLASAGRTFLVGGSNGANLRAARRDGRPGPSLAELNGAPRGRLFGVFGAGQGGRLLVAWTPKHRADKAEVRVSRFVARPTPQERSAAPARGARPR